MAPPSDERVGAEPCHVTRPAADGVGEGLEGDAQVGDLRAQPGEAGSSASARGPDGVVQRGGDRSAGDAPDPPSADTMPELVVWKAVRRRRAERPVPGGRDGGAAGVAAPARAERPVGGVIPALARTHRVPALSLPGHSGTAVTVSAYAPGRDTTSPTRRGILDPQAHLPRRGVRP